MARAKADATAYAAAYLLVRSSSARKRAVWPLPDLATCSGVPCATMTTYWLVPLIWVG